MKLALATLLLAGLLCGCGPKKVSPYTAATGQGIALSTQQINSAMWNIVQAVKGGIGPGGKAFLYAASHALDNAKQANMEAAMANDAVAKKADKLEKAYDKNKWIGWKTREYWHMLLAIWAGLGVISIVAGLTGFMGLSRLITQNLFIMSPFVWIRDFILKRRNPENTTTVVVQQQPPSVSVDSPSGATPVAIDVT